VGSNPTGRHRFSFKGVSRFTFASARCILPTGAAMKPDKKRAHFKYIEVEGRRERDPSGRRRFSLNKNLLPLKPAALGVIIRPIETGGKKGYDFSRRTKAKCGSVPSMA